MNDFGKKGGAGPTRGKRVVTYEVSLPDGTTAKKKTFHPPEHAASGYAYFADGRLRNPDFKWHVVSIDSPKSARFSKYTECPAKRID